MPAEDAAKNIRRVLTSTMVFVVCYMVCVGLYHVVVGAVLKLLGYQPGISLGNIYNVPEHIYEWSKADISTVFGIGALWLVVQVLLATYLYRVVSARYGLVRFVLLWYGVVSVNLLLILTAQGLIASMHPSWDMYQGLSFAAVWFVEPLILTIPLGLAALSLSFVIGFKLITPFLRYTCGTKKVATVMGRRNFLLLNFIVPVLLGFILLFHIHNPNGLFLHVGFIANLALVGIGLIWGSSQLPMGVQVYKGDVLNSVSPIFLLLLFAGYAAAAVFLA